MFKSLRSNFDEATVGFVTLCAWKRGRTRVSGDHTGLRSVRKNYGPQSPRGSPPLDNLLQPPLMNSLVVQ